jgi:hypothetical protein
MEIKLFRFATSKDCGTEWFLDVGKFGPFTLIALDAEWSDYASLPHLGLSIEAPWKRPLIGITFYCGKFSIWLQLFFFKTKWRDPYFNPELKDRLDILLDEISAVKIDDGEKEKG